MSDIKREELVHTLADEIEYQEGGAGANGAWGVANRLSLDAEVEDELYLREGGPE